MAALYPVAVALGMDGRDRNIRAACSKYKTAAQRYRPVPQSANAHPRTRHTSATVPLPAPMRMSGNA